MRYIVVGTSGSGKTTFARALAARLGVPHIELDALHWGPNWTPREAGEFSARVARAVASDSWVLDGNYSSLRPLLWPRATHIVWLNYARRIVYTRVLTRTIRRVVTKQALWAGNVETFRKSFLSRDSILLWSFSHYAKNRRQYPALQADPAYAHLAWHELRTPRDAARFLSVAAGTR